TRFSRDWSSDVCSSDLVGFGVRAARQEQDVAAADREIIGLKPRWVAQHGADPGDVRHERARISDARRGELAGIAVERMQLRALRSEERRVGREGRGGGS